MSDILAALYNGDIHPFEDSFPKTPEYKKLDDEFIRASDAFSDQLDKDSAEEYERLIGIYADLLFMQQAEHYIRGMRLGAKLALELLMEDKTHI